MPQAFGSKTTTGEENCKGELVQQTETMTDKVVL